jgi:uncharacterized YigZ family protein
MILSETLEEDHYNSIGVEGQGQFKDKGSKFLAYTFAVSNAEEVTEKLNDLRARYHDARHFCFAYRLNPEKPEVRYSDDGEPNNSAGIQIYNQLRSACLWNTLIVVVRYFGGTRLGVPGLINAYKEASALAIADSQISLEYLIETINLRFPYQQMNEVMRLVKESKAELIEERMGEDGGYLIGIRKEHYPELLDRIGQNHQWEIL